MGAIHDRRIGFVAAVSEIVGYKSGLALDVTDMSRLVPEYDELWLGDSDDELRIRSEEFEDVILKVLHRVGHIDSDSSFPSIDLLHKYWDSDKRSILIQVDSQVTQWFARRIQEEGPHGQKNLDPTPIVHEIRDQLGPEAELLALEVLGSMNEHLYRSPWGRIRRVEWANEAKLKELFVSESLQTAYGNFIDQRFLDYLAQNLDDIDRINWRKFEGLTAEFFVRQGYQVDLGPGRDDNGVDARVWLPAGDKSMPPLIIVQCKRTKKAVGKMVVKSLYADLREEGACSGLVVTSSRLSAGAVKVCQARAYPIAGIERPTLRRWIEAMRSVGKGVFMGE